MNPSSCGGPSYISATGYKYREGTRLVLLKNNNAHVTLHSPGVSKHTRSQKYTQAVLNLSVRSFRSDNTRFLAGSYDSNSQKQRIHVAWTTNVFNRRGPDFSITCGTVRHCKTVCCVKRLHFSCNRMGKSMTSYWNYILLYSDRHVKVHRDEETLFNINITIRNCGTHITGDIIGFLGHLVSRCDHSRKASFASLLLIFLSVGKLRGQTNTYTK